MTDHRTHKPERATRRPRFRAVRADTFPIEPVAWLLDEHIALAKLGALAGREGIGKGVTSSYIASGATRGTLPGDYEGQPASVLFVASEDGISDTLVPRLVAASADLAHVFFLEAESPEHLFAIVRDGGQLERAITDNDVALVFVDPVSEYLGEGTDEHRNTDVRRALRTLGSLAQETSAAIVTVNHLNKGQEGDLRSRMMGSVAYTAVPRVVLFLSRDPKAPDDEHARILSVQKSNLGWPAHPLRFSITTKRVALSDGVGSVKQPYIAGIEPARDITRDDVLEAPSRGEVKTSKLGLAKAIISAALANGEEVAGDVIATCAERDISEKTARRAASELDVQRRHDNSVPPVHFWSLPQSGQGRFRERDGRIANAALQSQIRPLNGSGLVTLGSDRTGGPSAVLQALGKRAKGNGRRTS